MSLTIRDWLAQALWVYEMLIFAYALMSWFTGLGPTARSVHRALGVVCEPFVGLVRRLLPKRISGAAGVDLSPLVAMLILILLQNLLQNLVR